MDSTIAYAAYLSPFHKSRRVGEYPTLLGALRKSGCGGCMCGGGSVHAVIDGQEQVRPLYLEYLPSDVLSAARPATEAELRRASDPEVVLG